MTNQNKVPDINQKFLEMDDGEVSTEEPLDFQPQGNDVATADIGRDMGGKMKEVARKDDKRFLVREEDPHLH